MAGRIAARGLMALVRYLPSATWYVSYEIFKVAMRTEPAIGTDVVTAANLVHVSLQLGTRHLGLCSSIYQFGIKPVLLPNATFLPSRWERWQNVQSMMSISSAFHLVLSSYHHTR